MSCTDIALHLSRGQAIMSREIRRNTGLRGYRYQQADRKANQRHSTKNQALKLTSEVTFLIDKYIKQDWSPEEVCGWLRREEQPEKIELHHETIYQYILANK
ncbi:MAG: IS30 family transposase [Oleiphilaceae bacterium]|jgi:IS30 family transposase